VKQVNIKYVKNLHPVFTRPKRIKIIVGGRGSTKSTGIADYVDVKVSTGELWCCARENQNSIEESVHRTLLDEVQRIGLTGFTDTKSPKWQRANADYEQKGNEDKQDRLS